MTDTPKTTKDPTRDTLETVARKILASWKKSDDQRLTAAMLLKEAKERVEAGEDKRFKTWKAWCFEMLPGRSERDISRLLKIANADNPEAAMSASRAKGKEQTAQWRAKKARADTRESSPAAMAKATTLWAEAAVRKSTSATAEADRRPVLVPLDRDPDRAAAAIREAMGEGYATNLGIALMRAGEMCKAARAESGEQAHVAAIAAEG
jgi:hypothetical protein